MDLVEIPMNVVAGVGIFVGVIECFFGFRIFKVIMGITGFLVGAIAAGGISQIIAQDELITIVAGLVGGLLGAVAAVTLYFVGVFLIGATLGGILSLALSAGMGNSPEVPVIVALAILCGVLAVIFQKALIIIATSLSGAWAVVTGAAYFATGTVDPASLEVFSGAGPNSFVILLCWLALGVLGIFIQYRLVPAARKVKLAQQGTASTPQKRPVEKLLELKDMLDKGLIAEQDYESKKAEILSKM